MTKTKAAKAACKILAEAAKIFHKIGADFHLVETKTELESPGE